MDIISGIYMHVNGKLVDPWLEMEENASSSSSSQALSSIQRLQKDRQEIQAYDERRYQKSSDGEFHFDLGGQVAQQIHASIEIPRDYRQTYRSYLKAKGLRLDVVSSSQTRRSPPRLLPIFN